MESTGRKEVVWKEVKKKKEKKNNDEAELLMRERKRRKIRESGERCLKKNTM